ncbi:hypothetical protein [Kitasatospora sp. NBC_00315]|uniref:hypothetical protein n=1 Tax=Kitasatospora sp. NBC_00315 TaxID=2975963 RepID=UPI00324656BF
MTSRRALGPDAARALAPSASRTASSRPEPAPHPVPAPPTRPDAAQALQRPAEQAADAIAALRHVRTPAAVLEAALHLAQALLDRPREDPHLLQAAEGLAAVIPQYLTPARTPAAPPSARLRPAPEPAVSAFGTLLA